MLNFGKNYLSTISPKKFFSKFNFFFSYDFFFPTIFFFFSLTWDHMGEKISNISESTHQIHQKIMHTPREGLPKLFKKLWNFKFWISAIFFFLFLLTWDHMGAKVSNTISSERTQKFIYTPREGLYQSC